MYDSVQNGAQKLSNEIPKVSIIVTCFNRKDTIIEAIESVLKQKYANIELIVVDDASIDGSGEVIADYLSATDREIKFLRNTINIGQNASLNHGFRFSTGDYFAFLDSDDEYDPEFVAQMLSALESNLNSSFAYCRIKGGPKWKVSGCNMYREVLKRGSLCNLGSLFVNKSAMSSIMPLPERLLPNDNCQDDAICFELSKKFCFVHVPKGLYIKKAADNQITNNSSQNLLAWITLFAQYRGDILNFSGRVNWIRLHAKIASRHSGLRVIEQALFKDNFKIVCSRFIVRIIFYFYFVAFSVRLFLKKAFQKIVLIVSLKRDNRLSC
jgi:glycosyltransferase involved in cell wall biosynthesis